MLVRREREQNNGGGSRPTRDWETNKNKVCTKMPWENPPVCVLTYRTRTPTSEQ